MLNHGKTRFLEIYQGNVDSTLTNSGSQMVIHGTLKYTWYWNSHTMVFTGHIDILYQGNVVPTVSDSNIVVV